VSVALLTLMRLVFVRVHVLTLIDEPRYDADVNGIMHIKSLTAFTNGVYASYNNDRIIFYQSSLTSTDFTAYVRPSSSPIRSEV
jgi:hypothetical protein